MSLLLTTFPSRREFEEARARLEALGVAHAEGMQPVGGGAR